MSKSEKKAYLKAIKSVKQAQHFLSVHAEVYNLFDFGRHLVSAENYRHFRRRAFASWKSAVAIWGEMRMDLFSTGKLTCQYPTMLSGRNQTASAV